MKSYIFPALMSLMLLGGGTALAHEETPTAQISGVLEQPLQLAQAPMTRDEALDEQRAAQAPNREYLEDGVDRDDSDAIGGLAPFLVFLLVPVGVGSAFLYAFVRKRRRSYQP